jgi:hypothetical protein
MMSETLQEERPGGAIAKESDDGYFVTDSISRRNRDTRAVILIGLSALVARCLYLASPYGFIGDADEAVFGLMAQRIGALEEFPLYCWQAHYASALVSYIGAAIFHFLDAGFVQLRLAMLPFAVMTPVILYCVYRRLCPISLAMAASFFVILCPPSYTFLSMAALGGYGEVFFGTALVIWLCLRSSDKGEPGPSLRSLFFLGVLCGFLFYISYFIIPAILAFAVPVLWIAQSKNGKAFPIYLTGFVTGALPFIGYNLSSDGGSFIRAASRGIGVGREIVSMAPDEKMMHVLSSKGSLVQSWIHLLPENVGYSIMPNYGTQVAGMAAGIVVISLIVWFAALACFSRDQWIAARSALFRPFAVFFLLYFLLCLVANLHAARHFSGLYFALPICLFAIAKGRPRRQKAVLAALCGLIGLQLIFSLDAFRLRQFDPRPAVLAMKEIGLREFYGSYASVYPVMFASDSQCVGSPALVAPGAPFSDRCPDCTGQVRAALSPAFVFLNGEQEEMRGFERFLGERNIGYAVKWVHGASIYHDLSVPVDADPRAGPEGRFVVRSPSSGTVKSEPLKKAHRGS